MTGIILYSLAGILLAVSFLKDRSKSLMALKKAWKSFYNLIPQMLGIMMFVGISLALLSPSSITKLIGGESGILGVVIATIIGSVTLIPGFVAFPLAAALLEGGAGYAQIAAFVSTLMGVGLITLPVEIQYFNRSTAILRNVAAFVIAMIFTLVIGQVMN